MPWRQLSMQHQQRRLRHASTQCCCKCWCALSQLDAHVSSTLSTRKRPLHWYASASAVRAGQVDTELVYAYAKTGDLGALEEFIAGTQPPTCRRAPDRLPSVMRCT